MDRRNLLKTAAAAACAAAVPEIVSIPTAASITVPWAETKLTAAHMAVMEPLVRKLIAGKTLVSLSVEEWNALATSHHMYHTLHGEAGDLGRIDAAIKANAAYFKTKVDPAAVDYIIAHGSYELMSHLSGHIIICRDKREGGPLAPDAGVLGPDWRCAAIYVAGAAFYGLIGLMLPEVALGFYLLGLGTDLFGLFSCA